MFAIARLAEVFMLREMETAQICQALRISQNNLWVTWHRARMALRECLGAELVRE